MDAFDLLGLAPTFELDEKALEQRYRDLQRTLHPDKFVQASASERRASLARAVSVNDAYRLLRDPLKRAAVLLTRYGGDVSERAGQPADPELLMEVMELREQLSEAKQQRDVPLRERLTAQVVESERATTAQLSRAFRALSAGDESAANALAEAARALSRLRYYRRFRDEVAILEDAEL